MMKRQGRPIVTHSANVSRWGEILTVTSGKGGVGKTNLALNLGIQLSRQGRRVILVDADFGFANADILMNITPLGDVTDLLDESRSVDSLLVDGPDGLRVLCGVSGLSRDGAPGDLDPRRFAGGLRRLLPACDTLIIDCGAGVNPLIESAIEAGDLTILVTTPEPTALADAYATLKVLHRRGVLGRVGTVVNMVRSEREAEDAMSRLQGVAKHFLGLDVEALGMIPHDPHVISAVQDRVPVTVRYPRCVASAYIDVISKHFLPRVAQPVRASGLLSRVASLFV